MSTYNAFSTEQKAIDAQVCDFDIFMKSNVCANYASTTLAWSEVLYSKSHDVWFYKSCPKSDIAYETMSFKELALDIMPTAEDDSELIKG